MSFAAPGIRAGDSAHRLRSRLALLGLASPVGHLFVLDRITGSPIFLRWGFPIADFLLVFSVFFALLFLLTMAAAWWISRTDPPWPMIRRSWA